MMSQNIFLWLQIGVLGFFTTLAVTGFMSIAGLGDTPDARSAHSGTVPTSGGVGVIAGMGAALFAVSLFYPDLNLPLGFAAVISLFFAIGMLGLVDDGLTLGAKTKFGIMVLICAAAVWLIGAPTHLPYVGAPITLSPVVGFMGSMLWIFVVMNAVNFMDGANGMIGLSLTVANVGLLGAALIGGSATTLMLSGFSLMVILGVLPYNLRRKARVFLGDVGSLSLGFLFAVAALYLIRETPGQSYHFVGPILLLPLLADVLLTLIRRVRKRENLLQAHNTHLYQRLIRYGLSHLWVSWLYALLTLLCANVVVIGLPRGWLNRVGLPLMMVGALAMAYVLISQALKDGALANSRNDKSS